MTTSLLEADETAPIEPCDSLRLLEVPTRMVGYNTWGDEVPFSLSCASGLGKDGIPAPRSLKHHGNSPGILRGSSWRMIGGETLDSRRHPQLTA